MATRSLETTADTGADTLYVWERQARPAIHAIVGGSCVRGMVMGTAGSGKSTILRELRRVLADRGTEATLLSDDTDVSQVPRSHALLVDDLHLLAPEQIETIRERSDDLTASLVATSRPWPQAESVIRITRTLERTRPAIVLGRVSRSDVLTCLRDRDRVISSACVDHLLQLTGGVSWLVSEALVLHDERDCTDDPGHRALIRAVEDRIAHRLDSVSPALRHEIETLCLASSAQGVRPGVVDDVIAQGYAEGLLARNGTPVPLVRSTVQAALPLRRALELNPHIAEDLARGATAGDRAHLDRLGGLHDTGVGEALREQADRIRERDPGRALDLYDGAIQCGIDAADVVGRRARAAWAAGDPERAGAILDELPLQPGVADSDLAADTAAAIWSLRGMMHRSHDVYDSLPPLSRDSHVRAAVAAFGAGTMPTREEPVRDRTAPSARSVAGDLLADGLRGTLDPSRAEASLADLVKASEMYTASATTAPIAELPAVIASIAAIGVGDVDLALSVIDEAVRGGQGGEWAQPRLLLWQAWVAIQRLRIADAREALARAQDHPSTLSPRDRMLAQAVRIAIVRRSEDATALDVAWTEARDSVLRIDVDLFTILPLAELVTAAARVDDTARLHRHFAHAIEIVEGLGAPPIWSAHLRWAGIQQGILRNRPDDLLPHARRLVAASPHSRVASTMAQAGRVWTATLAGSVDVAAVETAAQGLASVGLGWDGARLAGHGASRTSDRKASARLLSCARDMHPGDAVRSSARVADAERSTADSAYLSERELDVALLVLQGKTYAEIGETIFISPRTAEHHIAHIRRRLGATSRSDLIAKLRVVVDEVTSARAASAESEGMPGETRTRPPEGSGRPPMLGAAPPA